MKKDLILVVFPTYQSAGWYFEDNIKPIMSFLKRKDPHTYESDTYILRLCSFSKGDSLRGYDEHLVFLLIMKVQVLSHQLHH